MAAREGYEKSQVITCDGHAIRIFQKYSNFEDMLPIFFHQEFTFPCSVSPTSWWISVILLRGLTDGVTCKVDIKRTDHRRISLDADIWLRVVPPFNSNIVVSPKLTARGMLPNVKAVEKISCFVPNDFLKQLRKEPVTLKVFFRIHGCHQGSEIASAVKEYFPPITQKEMSLSKL